MYELIWGTLSSSHLAYISADLVYRVTYDPAILYSTVIVAILLTKGYGMTMALAIGRKLLHEPSRKIWMALSSISPRQIMYYGLRWGIPLHQLRELVMLHRIFLKRGQQFLSKKPKKKRKSHHHGRTQRLNSTVSWVPGLFTVFNLISTHAPMSAHILG